MSFTIREALQIVSQQGASIIAGKQGLDRIIEWIDILETPDSYAWVRPNEFAITTGYSIKDDTEWQLRLIRSLARVGGAGLGIKFGRFIGAVPTSLVDEANKLGVPLISFPDEIPYIDITHPLMSRLVNEQAERLRYSDYVYKKLTRVALESSSMDRICEELQRLLKKKVIISTHLGNQLYKLDNRNYQSFPVQVKDRIYGFIYIESQGGISDYDLVAIEHTRVLVALQLMQYELAVESSWNERRDLLDDLLSGDLPAQQVLKTRADVFGFSLNEPRAVCIADIDGFAKFLMKHKISETTAVNLRRQFFKSVQQLILSLMKYNRDFLTVQKSDQIILLYNPSLVSWEKLSVGIQNCMAQIEPNLTVSVVCTHVVSSLERVPIMYEMALRLLKIARTVQGGGSILHQSDAEVYLILDSMQDKELVESILGEILKSKHREAYLQTLREYIRLQGNLTEVSKALFIHRNTLRYRLRKIEDLLGKNLENAEHRAIIWWVLRSLDIHS